MPLLLSCAAALVLLAVPAAQASFHLMKIREVYPGASNDSYVVIQMLDNGEYMVGGHSLRIYDATGATVDTFTFTAGYQAPNHNSASGNNTILIGDTGVQAAFGASAAPDDHTDASLNIPAAGAACWLDGSPPDCVAWGNFTGGASLPAPGAGTPVSSPAVTAGKAIRRSIAAGCATLLESGDDTNNSSADFSEQTPNPRNNASTVTESTCAGLPDTTIGTKPALRTQSTSASFSFTASPSTGATFECNLDDDISGFTACTTPASYSSLALGEHEFSVRAVNGAGPDPSPAEYHWVVDQTPPTAIIDNPKPPIENSGVGVTFKYHAEGEVGEVGFTFECSVAKELAADAFASCPSTGKTLPKITENGKYVFKVRAIDQALNVGAATPFPFTVNTSLADTTAPETTITEKPSDPSSSTTAEFTYQSNELNSTFQCKMDAESFAACPASGKSYTGLGEGQHTFQVRATDASNNTDLSPAGYSFSIVLVTQPPEIKPPEVKPPEPTSTPPETIITTKPKSKTQDRTPTFKFKSSVPGAAYECKLDGKALKPCRSPLTTKPLSFGKHTLKVSAKLPSGLKDSTPAVCSFKVVKPR
jgi:hypothetical protein